MAFDRAQRIMLGGLAVLVTLGMVGPAIASPAPVSGCPPCGSGFIRGAAPHGLDTDVQHGEATVRVHTNGSATWTVRVIPTNETVLNRLAENQSLARAVATDSFGTRYGSGIAHELIRVEIADGAFVMRYRTLGVVQKGPFRTHVFTYFRDSPGAYVYTDLGADELTVVAPHGMTIARGFGDVTGNKMTATELPDVRDGPFVVVAPQGSFAPGAKGTLAIASTLQDVIVRNLLYFVALPGGVIIGGLAGIRRFCDSDRDRDPTRLGSIVAIIGAILLAGAIFWEGDALPAVTGNFLIGGFGGAVLLALGASVAAPRVRQRLTGLWIVGAGIALGIIATIVTDELLGASGLHRSLAMGVALLPAAVGLGWVDARNALGEGPLSRRLFIGLSVAIVGALVVSAPLTALGGSLFVFVPILLTVAAVGFVIIAVPLYVLGAAGANAERA